MHEVIVATASFMIGVLVGMVMVVFAADHRAVNRGWVEHQGKLYVLTPAKPVASP